MNETIEILSQAASQKVKIIKKNPSKYWVSSVFAGALIGLGVLVSFTVGAILTCNRTKNDAAKLIIIIMCIYAFMTSGFEHSIADMTVFAIAIMSKSITSISIGQAAYALFFITIGNIIGGSLLVGWVANKIK